MGREIRRVPPNWKHPVYTEDDAPRRNLVGKLRPCDDKDYETAAKEWIEDFEKWQRGEHDVQGKSYASSYRYFWEYGSPPDEAVHRPAFTEEPTWFQMYETVSEGTPCTPPFETKEELVDWLVEKGECHGTRHERRFTRAQAEAFVKQEWAPSFVFTKERGIETGVEHSETVQYRHRRLT